MKNYPDWLSFSLFRDNKQEAYLHASYTSQKQSDKQSLSF